MLHLREYQKRSLEALETFLKDATRIGPTRAFVMQTGRPYRSVHQLGEPPYVCLRVPTGGGKTFMACHALGIAARDFIHKGHVVCLWLVPSNTIREQTLAALRNRSHPYRQAVETFFPGTVTVLDLAESLYVQQSTLLGETTIIVSTLAALRVEDTDGRKIYESSGNLQHHFSALTKDQEERLERDAHGVLGYSLANVLRLHRPVVIMDEAHNARTKLSFETLARLSPSCIIEFTATPQTVHKPDMGLCASNVLHQVSANELKAEQMVKLPIRLRTRPEWKEVVAQAVHQRVQLEAVAAEEEKQTGEYIRPIVLLQAQPQSKEKETLTVEALKKCLLEDFRIPEEQIAIATGQTREIDDVDLFARDCPLRFIITVQALKEGWDCSFAYVLCSVQETHSGRAVEQVLGRILRLPGAKLKRHDDLNCSYAFAASQHFIDAANSLKDALLENGFERIEADQLVTSDEPQADLPLWTHHTEKVEEEKPDLKQLPQELGQRVTYDENTKSVRVTGVISETDRDALKTCFKTDQGKEAVERLYHKSHGRAVRDGKALEVELFRVPALAIRVGDQLELFEESHYLDFEWKLGECDESLAETDFPTDASASKMIEVDVSDIGKVEVHFVEELHQQMSLLSFEKGWTQPALVNWLDRNIPHPDIIRTESTLFVDRVLEALVNNRGINLEQLAGRKFRLRDAIAERIEDYRKKKSAEAFQRVLFQMPAREIEVGPEIVLEISKANYAPSNYYQGQYRFKKHLFPLVGDMNDEEAECGFFLDQMEEVKLWVRNLERRPESSFWLPTSTDRFYPDFVVLLNDGRWFVVEYKGADRWTTDDSKEKRKIGALWADRSDGQCVFVMVTEKKWDGLKKAVTK